MTIYFTSDLHFGHRAIINYNPSSRLQFGNTVEEMDNGIITAWNAIVNHEDTIYILGDISFHKATRTLEILKSLKGNKILIVGNHDQRAVKNPEFCKQFSEIHQYLEVKFENIKFVMSHYNMANWNGMRYGSIMLHGHLHGAHNGLVDQNCRCMDVGVDATRKIMVSLDEVLSKMLTFQPKDNRYNR